MLNWKKIAFGIGATALYAWASLAQATALQPFQGGTGFSTSSAGTVGQYLQVSTTSPFLGYAFATVPTGVVTTTINGAQCPSFTFSINATTVAASAFTVSTSSCNVFLNILKYTSSTDISVSTTGTIVFASHNISQFTNDVPYLTSSTGVTSFNSVTGAITGVNSVNNATGTVTVTSSSLNVVWSSVNRNTAPNYNVIGDGTTVTTTVSGATTTFKFATTSISQFVNDSHYVTSSASAAGSQTQIQYNDGGFAATSTLTFSSSTHIFVTAGTSTPTISINGISTSLTNATTVGNVNNTTGTIAITPLGSSTQNFGYTGSVASWTVPAAITSITINVKGAAGFTSLQGKGGSSTGTLAVTPGTVYWYCVGGMGFSGVGGTSGACGGGGSAAPNGSSNGGGGMTWFSSTSTFSTSTVIIVAGGGGGPGANGSTGGNGGGTTGSTGGGPNPGNGGTQSSGGTGGGDGNAGSAGQGGNAANGSASGGGGGGGGYFGGGAGGSAASGQGGAGGGGSGFILQLPTVTGNNNAGVVTEQRQVSSTAPYVLTFAGNPWANANGVSCTISPNNATNTWYVANTTSSFTVTFTTALSTGQSFNYLCLGY